MPYLSSHKLRHGHTVYALKRAQNMGQLKAISQNIMHESVITTDQIDGRLINDDVQEIISSLRKNKKPCLVQGFLLEIIGERKVGVLRPAGGPHRP